MTVYDVNELGHQWFRPDQCQDIDTTYIDLFSMEAQELMSERYR